MDLLINNCTIKKGTINGDNISTISYDYEDLMSQPYEPRLEELISGALESAFWVMDSIILNDKRDFKITGDVKSKINKRMTLGSREAKKRMKKL